MCTNCLETVALEAMAQKAIEMGVRGVAAILTVQEGVALDVFDPQLKVVGRFYREPDPARGGDDEGTNYWAVVMAKVARMLRIGTDSDDDQELVQTGEFPYAGGVTEKVHGLVVYMAFSGATQDQDREIAAHGLAVFTAQANLLVAQQLQRFASVATFLDDLEATLRAAGFFDEEE
jgi:hypothetical protein